jgi:hypothetical protein
MMDNVQNCDSYTAFTRVQDEDIAYISFYLQLDHCKLNGEKCVRTNATNNFYKTFSTPQKQHIYRICTNK